MIKENLHSGKTSESTAHLSNFFFFFTSWIPKVQLAVFGEMLIIVCSKLNLGTAVKMQPNISLGDQRVSAFLNALLCTNFPFYKLTICLTISWQ